METGMIPLDGLLAQWDADPIKGQFEPCAHYYESMDAIVFLQEDQSYRADRVDNFLTLLWHPQEQRAIGVKIKGWRHLFCRLQTIAATLDCTLEEHQFVRLTAGLEIAMTAAGAEIVADAERERIAESYATARAIVGSVRVHAQHGMVA